MPEPQLPQLWLDVSTNIARSRASSVRHQVEHDLKIDHVPVLVEPVWHDGVAMTYVNAGADPTEHAPSCLPDLAFSTFFEKVDEIDPMGVADLPAQRGPQGAGSAGEGASSQPSAVPSEAGSRFDTWIGVGVPKNFVMGGKDCPSWSSVLRRITADHVTGRIIADETVTDENRWLNNWTKSLGNEVMGRISCGRRSFSTRPSGMASVRSGTSIRSPLRMPMRP